MKSLAVLACCALISIWAPIASAQESQFVNIHYPSTITVQTEVKNDWATFFVSLNDESVASFHVVSSLSGEQHYIANEVVTSWDPSTYPALKVSYPGDDYWRLVGDGGQGNFGWQAQRNFDKGYGVWVFSIYNENFDSGTQFSYWFDKKQPIPEPPAAWMALLGTLTIGWKCANRKAPRRLLTRRLAQVQ